MKVSSFVRFATFGLGTILFKWKKPILGTVILTDKCNLNCKHCAVNNISSIIYPYERIKTDMKNLYHNGIRILFFCGGETFLWTDEGKTLADLVSEAKNMGFLIVNVVTNGTFPIDLPEADLILVSIDGGMEKHNYIRGDTYETIINNIQNSKTSNICFYMAINKYNKSDISIVCETAKKEPNVKAASFNFHTPYPGTEELSLTIRQKQDCCDEITKCIKNGAPVFNLVTAFPYIINNNFDTPCNQCVVIENGIESVCGRCIDILELCSKCGYFFVAEYSLVFKGNVPVVIDMLKTYLKYV